MFVCASTECFPDLPLLEACEKLIDLEYTAVEVALHESGGGLTPSQIAADVEGAIDTLRQTHRLTITALNLEIEAEGDAYYEQFAACCKVAKALKVVPLIVPSAELGTPFNEEIERLRELVRLSSIEGALVALKTEIGCMSEDPDTAAEFCKHVKGLGINLDPSHYTCGPHRNRSYDKLFPHTVHVHLRDTKPDQLQVRVGQGEIEYNRIITMLQREGYQRALSVHMPPMEDVDHRVEMRKMRLLLDSFL